MLAQKPERVPGFKSASGFNALPEPAAPCAVSHVVRPLAVIPVPYGHLNLLN